ncbi:MAG: hypothetical protein EOP45_14950, partial [Sphingobacteriaceae bacterium]
MLSSDSSSDIAINGSGFMVVNSEADGRGITLYTRSGSFRNDAKGNYVNSAGYTLMGWPLDNESRLPGENGNSNTTPSSLLTSLAPVNVKSITGSASGTTTVSLGINLNETQKILQGSGEMISFASSATANYNISSTDPISPENNTPNILNISDILTLTPSDPGTTYNFIYGGISRGNDINQGILGASTSQANFAGALDGQGFTITINGNTTNYTYQSTNPIAANGQFNTPANLVAAINQTSGIHARIATDNTGSRIIITPTDANMAMSFADTNGGSFVTAVGLTDTIVNPAGNRFASLGGLSKLINASAGLSANISNPIQGANLKFYATDSLGKLKVEATGSGIAPDPVSDSTSVLSEFGLNTTNATSFGPAYDPSDIDLNMASGNVSPHFTRNIQIYDAFGTGHNVQVGFLKTAPNTWEVEIFAQDPTDLISSRTDGQVAVGQITFNGDGSLRLVDTSLTLPITINWANQSVPSKMSFNWGSAGEIEGTIGAISIGKTDGLRQV